MCVTKGCCKRREGAERPRRTRSRMHIGYARVSTDDQQLHLQLDALTTAGCTQIFHDEGISGAQVQRPGLDAALTALTPGDVLVVWRLDRLRALGAAPGEPGAYPGAAGGGVPVTHGGHEHDHGRGQAGVSYHGGPRRI